MFILSLFLGRKDGDRIIVACIILYHAPQRRTKAILFIVLLPIFAFFLKAKCKLKYSKVENNEVLFSAT